MLKDRTLLNEMVFQQAKFMGLRKDGCLVVQGTVLEVKYQMVRNDIAVGVLGEIALGQSLAVECAQH